MLAAIHGIHVAPELTAALELRDFDGSPLRRHFDSERARYEWARDDRHFPTIERGFDVLEAHWPEHEQDARISWGDARLGNILWSGVEPVAVLDWEMVALTPPEVDLSWMVFFAEYFQRSAERRGLPGIPGFLASGFCGCALRARHGDDACSTSTGTSATPRFAKRSCPCARWAARCTSVSCPRLTIPKGSSSTASSSSSSSTHSNGV